MDPERGSSKYGQSQNIPLKAGVLEALVTRAYQKNRNDSSESVEYGRKKSALKPFIEVCTVHTHSILGIGERKKVQLLNFSRRENVCFSGFLPFCRTSSICRKSAEKTHVISTSRQRLRREGREGAALPSSSGARFIFAHFHLSIWLALEAWLVYAIVAELESKRLCIEGNFSAGFFCSFQELTQTQFLKITQKVSF